MNKIWCLSLGLLLWLALPSWGAPVLQLDPQQEVYPLGLYLEVLEDPSQRMTLPEIQRTHLDRDFVPNQQAVPNFAFSQSAFWLKFTLNHQQNTLQRWLLELDYPNVDHVSLYGPNPTQERLTGRHYPFAHREIKHRNFVFELQIPPQQTQTYYLRIASNTALRLPLTLYQPQAFLQRDHDTQLWFGLYYGLIAMLLFYSLVLALIVHNHHYLRYALTLLTLHGMFQLTTNGLAYEYLWPEAVWWNSHCWGVIMDLAVASTLWFCLEFLKVKTHFPRLARMFLLLQGLALILAVLNLLPDDNFGSFMSVFWSVRLALITTLLVWLTAIATTAKGYVPARFFLFAWSLMLAGGLVTGLQAIGWLPAHFWTVYALQFGSALEGMLLAFAMGYQMQQEQLKILQAQQKALEEESLRRQSQEEVVLQLQQLDRLKDDFMANVSHELRTPLNGVIGLSESLLDGVAGELNGRQQQDIYLVMNSAKRLYRLVQDLLDFSQLKHTQLQLHNQNIWLRELTDVILPLLQPLIAGKPLQLRNQIPADTPPVWADEDRVQQILHNLIGNALKFTHDGQVTITAKVLGEKQLEILVTDTGPGIPPEQQVSIFDAFTQGEASLTRTQGGTGLGLTITRQLVELHGGKLWVDSEVGKGATFHFTLPLSHTSGPALREYPQHKRLPTRELVLADIPILPEPTQKVFHLLVVDDEPINLQVLVNMLALQHYTVTKANNGEQALALLQQRKFDLVLLDIMMPRMSGYEVSRVIRETYPPDRLPIVFLTAKNQVSDIVEGFQAGANDFLTKPVAKNELLARIRTHLQLSHINAAYARFVPREFLEYLGRDSIIDVQLGDQVQRDMTILFSDIRSFTTLSEILTPKQNFDFMNDYLSRMSPVIRLNRGFIDKYLGDGIMALFPHQTEDALQAALDMLAELDIYNDERLAEGFLPIEIGIGLHTGSLMLGTIGEEQRMESTVISDAVNLAARMEGLTKIYGATLIISEQTRQDISLDESGIRFLGREKVKGKSLPVPIYEVLTGEKPLRWAKEKTRDDFEAGVHLFLQHDIAAAQTHFQAVWQQNPDDLATLLYMRRCRRYLEGLPDTEDDGLEIEIPYR